MTDQRTTKQNKSLHQYYELLAIALNEAGLDMKKVLKPTIDIPWTKTSVKEHLWRPIQEAMLSQESTTEMKTNEIDKIYEVLDRHTSEKLGVHVEWPSRDNEFNDFMMDKYNNG